MAIHFSAHGKTTLKIIDNIIILECEGPWNIEFFHILHQQIYQAVQQCSSGNYSVLLIPIGETIGTPDTMDYHIKFLKKGNPSAIAVNLSRSDIPQSTKNLCRLAYQTAELTYDFFMDNESAIHWLKENMR
jgi:hypothetical protein